MKKFFAWMKDTGGFGSYIALTIIIGLLGYMYASVIFHLNNIYSRSVHTASGWWHLFGWLLTGAAVFAAVKLGERESVIFFGVLLAASLWAFTGFAS